MSLRRYEKEFKEEAVVLANDFGVTVAADKLGIPV
jgi:transposase-like protein